MQSGFGVCGEKSVGVCAVNRDEIIIFLRSMLHRTRRHQPGFDDEFDACAAKYLTDQQVFGSGTFICGPATKAAALRLRSYPAPPLPVTHVRLPFVRPRNLGRPGRTPRAWDY